MSGFALHILSQYSFHAILAEIEIMDLLGLSEQILSKLDSSNSLFVIEKKMVETKVAEFEPELINKDVNTLQRFFKDDAWQELKSSGMFHLH